MLDPSPGLPAHVALLLNEQFDLEDFDATRRKLRGMLSDLRAQAEIADYQQDLPSPDPREFRVVLSGGLDLFASEGACQKRRCRLQYAERVARSISLMADHVVLHDYIRFRITHLRSRPSNASLRRIVNDLYVLKKIEPLIRAGLVHFAEPTTYVCKNCHSKFRDEVEGLIDTFAEELISQVEIERDPKETTIRGLGIYDPPVINIGSQKWNEADDGQILREVIAHCIEHAMRDARASSLMSGTMFSNSPIGLRSLLAKEGAHLSQNGFRAFAGHRAADLPWVQGLTIEQTISLRHEAATALPVLRESLARKLSANPEVGNDNATLNDVVAELRQQAAEVRAELTIATRRTPSIQKNAVGVLGLGISALSIAAGNLPGAAASLLSTLGLIHQVPGVGEAHTDRLKAKPGYVLVAAQDILAHAPK